MEQKVKQLATRWVARLKPPEKMLLSAWAEKHIQLPQEHSARPGKYRNWPYMREMLDCMGDDVHERVSVMKSARLGYTKGLMIAMGAIAATNPSQIMLLMPTDEDAAEIAVDEVEPMFESTPALKGLMRRSHNGGNNLRNKQLLGGGSIKIRSAKAPRKLRRLDVKILLIDEADGMEVTKEGDPISIAEKRTLAKANRKIVVGSTPTEEGISTVERLFNNGDMRIYEVPCPKCGVFSEIKWDQVEWTMDQTGHNVVDAHWRCPHCRNLIEERYKPQMIEAGRWHKMRPEVKDHASFRINALVSLLPNASWVKLAAEHIAAKRAGPAFMQVFRNTILGLPWRTTLNRVDAETLMDRAEPWGYFTATRNKTSVPAEVLMILAGADVQDDRVEITLLGVGIDGARFILGHLIFPGNTLEDDVWKAVDRWHRTFTVRHPNGWLLGIDAMAVDSGGREGRTQKVYDWCGERYGRMIYAIKGDEGPNRKVWTKAKKVKGNARLAILGLDVLKTAVLDGLGSAVYLENGERNPNCIRFSDQLEPVWYEQVTNETRRIRYVDNRPKIEFKPKRAGAAVEALDCTVYATALLECPTVKLIDLHARWLRKPTPLDPADTPPAPRKKRSIADIAKEMNGG